MDLGNDNEFTVECFPCGDASWKSEYPKDRLFPLTGTIIDELMCAPDMWDSDGEPYLLAVKSGNATNTTIGCANGVFSIVRDYYFTDMPVNQTSIEWEL